MATQDSMIAGLFTTPEQYQQQQDQLATQQAIQMAQLAPEQRAQADIRGGFQRAGNALGGLMGAQDPMMKLAALRQQALQGLDPNNPQSMMQVAQQLAQAGDQQGAMQVAQQARAAQEQLAKTSSEGVIGKLLQSGKYTPESVNTYAKTGSGLELADKGGGEFEHLLKTLNLPPAQANQLRQQRAMAMLNNDPNGIKAVTAQLAALQLQEKEFKFKQEQEKAIGEKTQAIQKLSSVESNVEDSLDTAAKALKLAPGSFMQASGQALAANIPWTDQRSLKNLVSSLNSDKAIGTLQDLKAQSKTGATGFGALNTKELQLVLDKTRSLDPSDKMFKENLLTVMEGWQKIQKGAMESRINLQGNEGKLKELRSLVSAVKTKGAMTAAQKDQIDALKSELGIR